MPHPTHSLVYLDYTAPVVQMRNPQVGDSDIGTLGAFLTGALVRAHLVYTVRAICFVCSLACCFTGKTGMGFGELLSSHLLFYRVIDFFLIASKMFYVIFSS